MSETQREHAVFVRQTEEFLSLIMDVLVTLRESPHFEWPITLEMWENVLMRYRDWAHSTQMSAFIHDPREADNNILHDIKGALVEVLERVTMEILTLGGDPEDEMLYNVHMAVLRDIDMAMCIQHGPLRAPRSRVQTD